MAKKNGAPPSVMEIRRANLRMLIAQWGGPSSLAKKLKLSGPSYLSQLISDNRPFTEKTARKFEAALDLSLGWLDQERMANGKPAPVDDHLMTQAVLLMGTALEETGVSLPPVKFSNLVVMVYEEAVRTGSLNEDYVKRLIRLLR